MSCVFCEIINGNQAANILYEDDKIIAFDDINPKAPHHKLVIPKKHIATLNDLVDEDKILIGDMIFVAKKLAADLGIAENGYKVLFNCNKDGGQIVYHLHLHLLGGRPLGFAR